MRIVKKLSAAVAVVGLLAVLGASAAAAAPPDLTANKNAAVVPVDCEGYGEFFVWIPNAHAYEKFLATGQQGAPGVGHPIGVDVPIGVQKTEGQGAAFDRTIECITPLGPVNIMPTGKPATD